MPETIKGRFRNALEFYVNKVGMPVEQVHVTDRRDEEGNRIYESAWFFGDEFAMEAHYFVSKDDFDVSVVDSIAIWRVDVQNYDFENATDDSRMSLTYNTAATSGSLTATGSNCDSLAEVLHRFIIPRTSG